MIFNFHFPGLFNCSWSTLSKAMVRLTFYQEEVFKLGYIVASSMGFELFGNKVIGKKISEVKKE